MTHTTSTATPESERANSSLGRSFHKLFSASIVSNLGDGMAIVAYPWLASAVTRNPILIALVAVAQRLPWLIFTLPAGVITDRVDRRRMMVVMDVTRGLLTLAVAFAVLGAQGDLPGPDAVDQIVGTTTGLYFIVVTATLLLGMAEVLRDNSAQTMLPDVVAADQLEKANGRLWSIEGVMNTFAGPPLGSLLLLVAFSLPFFVDAATFFLSAALLVTIPGTFRAPRDQTSAPTSFRADLSEGVRWLMAHPLLKPMAIILGLMNAAAQISFATFVLFAQEVMNVGPVTFTVIFFGAAIGGLVGGNIAPAVTRRLGSGTTLALTLLGCAVIPVLIGTFAWWPLVLVLLGVNALLGILWNVVTVSLRQTIIPSHLLGRVNSVYRFFAWGMMPIGAAIGGLIVYFVARIDDRDMALRFTWFANGLVHLGLFVFGRSRLTTDKIEAARNAGAAPAR